MANYFEMTRDELTAEKAALEENYKKFQAMGLKLNMARGKPIITKVVKNMVSSCTSTPPLPLRSQ